MSGYQEKVAITILLFLLLFNLRVAAQSFSGFNAGINSGFDFREKYVDNAIADRYVKIEKRIGLVLSYSKEYRDIILNVSINPYMNLARIHPYILSNLDPGPQNRKDYFGLKTDYNVYLGGGFLKPTVGISAGVIPKYPYEIKNYLRNSSTSLEWGLFGGLTTLLTKKKGAITFGYYYSSIITGEEIIYNSDYAIWQISYQFYLKRE